LDLFESHPAVGLGLLMLTLLWLFAASIAFIYARRARKRDLAAIVTTVSVIWLATFFVILLTVSLGSTGKVLTVGQAKHFCGFYLDCHLSVEVSNVTKSKTVGSLPNQRTAQGIFYVVDLKVLSDARKATIAPYDLDLRVRTDKQTIARSLEGEGALEPVTERTVALNQPVGPGRSYTKQVVFDVPADATQANLQVTEGPWIDHLLELFLIGDEDSLFHKPTLLSLELAQ
jgi:Domain of unknown function (DUF4352)